MANQKNPQKNPIKRHQHHNDLTGEHAIGDAGQLFLAVIFLIVWTTDTFFIHWSTLLNQQIPIYIRIPLAVSLFILAFYLARTGLRMVFGGESGGIGVIRERVFNIVRHPVYLSELLLYLGFLMLSLSLAALVVWLIACIFLHYISRFEEKLLLERFGDEYSRYMEEVPMWFPRLRRK